MTDILPGSLVGLAWWLALVALALAAGWAAGRDQRHDRRAEDRQGLVCGSWHHLGHGRPPAVVLARRVDAGTVGVWPWWACCQQHIPAGAEVVPL